MRQTDAILSRLLELHPNKLIDLKLDRIKRLLDEMGHPETRVPPVIHVAGTNGKGSTIAFLGAILEAAGHRVHVYTSPHLVRFNERIRLAGALVSDAALSDALERCETVNDGRPITFFEITTAAAFLLFSQFRADYLLLETGLGGQFDATNVIGAPLGTLITPVSMDHTEFLGNDVDAIAREKAGILKAGVPAVFGRQADSVRDVLEGEAERLGVSALFADQDFQAFGEHGRMVFQDPNGLLDLPLPALAGAFQIQNAGLAIAAVRHFDLPADERAIEKGIGIVRWPARFMELKHGALKAMLHPGQHLWLDGGHNEAGGKALSEALLQTGGQSKPWAVILGAYANKDMEAYLAHFAGIANPVLAVPMPGDRPGWPPEELVNVAQSAGLAAHAVSSVTQALRKVADEGCVRTIICGSLHLAGDVLALNETPPT